MRRSGYATTALLVAGAPTGAPEGATEGTTEGTAVVGGCAVPAQVAESPARGPARPLARATSEVAPECVIVPTAPAPSPARPSLARAKAGAEGSLASAERADDPLRLWYDLRSAVSHEGPSLNAGHFVTFAESRGGRWQLHDDSVVRDLPEYPRGELGRKAYLLYYVLREVSGNGTITA